MLKGFILIKWGLMTKTGSAFLFTALLTLFSPLAKAAGFLSLGVSLSPDYAPFAFPCERIDPVVTCGPIKISDKSCARTLEYKTRINGDQIQVSCTVNSGEKVIVATSYGVIMNDWTQDGYGSLLVKLNPRFTFEENRKILIFK